VNGKTASADKTLEKVSEQQRQLHIRTRVRFSGVKAVGLDETL
jgi:hypothetical protein